jgi:ABC-2 type transport system ATP-binding protein
MWVSELTPLTPDLENVFLELTGTMPDPTAHRQVDDAPRDIPAQPIAPTAASDATAIPANGAAPTPAERTDA